MNEFCQPWYICASTSIIEGPWISIHHWLPTVSYQAMKSGVCISETLRSDDDECCNIFVPWRLTVLFVGVDAARAFRPDRPFALEEKLWKQLDTCMILSCWFSLNDDDATSFKTIQEDWQNSNVGNDSILELRRFFLSSHPRPTNLPLTLLLLFICWSSSFSTTRSYSSPSRPNLTRRSYCKTHSKWREMKKRHSRCCIGFERPKLLNWASERELINVRGWLVLVIA